MRDKGYGGAMKGELWLVLYKIGVDRNGYQRCDWCY